MRMRPRSGDPGALPVSATVLLLIDFINPLDFEGAQNLRDAAVAAARATAVLKRRARSQGIVCIYANDNYATWHSSFEDVHRHGTACARDRRRAGCAQLLAPTQADFTVLNHARKP